MKNQQQSSYLYFLFAAVFISILILLFFSVRVSEQNQNIASRAASDQATVLVDVLPSASPYFLTNTSSKLTFRVNTQNLNIYGVQIIADILTDTTSTYSLVIPPESGLELISQKMIDTTGGKRLFFAVRPKNVGGSFSTGTYIEFAQLYFVPNHSGKIVMDTSPTVSHSTVYGDPGNDQLRQLPRLTFEVRDPLGPELTPTPMVSVVSLPSAGTGQASMILGVLAALCLSLPLIVIAFQREE